MATGTKAIFVSHGGVMDDCAFVTAHNTRLKDNSQEVSLLSRTQSNEYVNSNRSDVNNSLSESHINTISTKLNTSSLSYSNAKPYRPTVALIIGAMKAGTMTLWQALSSHPYVFRTVKEHHYFDTGYETQSIDEYLCNLQGSCQVPVGGQLHAGLRFPVLAPQMDIDLRPEVQNRY